MRSTNPRDVAYMFRDYARDIHAKAVPADPNFLRISVACGKVRLSLLFSSTSYVSNRVSEVNFILFLQFSSLLSFSSFGTEFLSFSFHL